VKILAKSAANTISNTYKNLLKAFEDVGKQLEAEFKQLTDAQLKWKKTATVFILTWMRGNFRFYDQFDTLFNREKHPSSADMFSAAVALALSKYLSKYKLQDAVRSEVKVPTKPKAICPDITVWNNENKLIAFVECKTQLGYQRESWSQQYKDRTKEIKKIYHHCSSYLCVLTKRNWEQTWPIFENSPLVGKNWFCLTDVWPTDIGDSVNDRILYPIEPMFIEIKKSLKKRN
jgi:hypothetical protein